MTTSRGDAIDGKRVGTFTFVVTTDGVLRVAPRHSEHVVCAAGGEVLSAGEIRVERGRVVSVSNQSTGYCPEPESWPAEKVTLLNETDLERFVFIDESFVHTGMRREHGRSLRGQRVKGLRPFRSWKTVSLIGAIRLGEKPKITTSESAVDGRTFLRFVKERLAPWIYPGDIVVMDNLNIHKMLVVREAILDAGGLVSERFTNTTDANLARAHSERI